MRTVGEKIYRLRKEKGLSQEELADKLNVARQTVSKWEVGTATPNFEKLTALCQFFGVDSDYFICGKKIAASPVEESVLSEVKEESSDIKEEAERKTKHKTLKIVLTTIAAIVLAFGIVIKGGRLFLSLAV